MVNGIRDFNRYVEDIVGCLKPGGIALLAEGDWRPYQEDKTVSMLFFHSVGLCIEFLHVFTIFSPLPCRLCIHWPILTRRGDLGGAESAMVRFIVYIVIIDDQRMIQRPLN